MKLFFIIELLIISSAAFAIFSSDKKEIKRGRLKLLKLWTPILITILFLFTNAFIFLMIDTSDFGATYEYKDSVVIPLDLIEGEVDKVVTIKNGELTVAWNDANGNFRTVDISTKNVALVKYSIKNGDVKLPCLKIHFIKNTRTFFIPGVIPMREWEIILPMDYHLEINN